MTRSSSGHVYQKEGKDGAFCVLTHFVVREPISLSKSHDGMSNKLLLQTLDKHVPN